MSENSDSGYEYSNDSDNADYEYIDKVILRDEKNRTLFDWSPQAIVFVNNQGIFLDANRRLYEWLGYRPEEIIGRRIDSTPFFTEETKKIIVNSFNKRMFGENIPPYEVEFIHKNGDKKWGQVHGALFRDESNNITFDIVMVSDITEKKNAIDNLKESEERYRNLFENAYDLIQSVNENGNFLDANPRWLEVLEYSKEEVQNLNLTNIIHKDEINHCIEIFDKIKKGESFKNIRTIFITKSGKAIHVEGSSNGFFKDGKFIATIGIFREISDI